MPNNYFCNNIMKVCKPPLKNYQHRELSKKEKNFYKYYQFIYLDGDLQ